jgi:hypothetical protein
MTALKKITTVFAFFAFGFLAASQAQVIENDAVLVETPGGDFGDYEVGLAQTTSFNGGDEMGLFAFGIAEQSNGDLQFNAIAIGETYALFFADLGDAVGPEFATGTDVFASNFDVPSSDFFQLAAGESQYFAYYDDRTFETNNLSVSDFPEVVTDDDNFGWFRLERLGGGDLSITDGATAKGAGIVVGTTNTFAVPEPTTSTLLMLCTLARITLRTRKRGQV